MYYTLGQRRGLGIGGRGDGRSFFVVGKDLENNRLIVVQGEDHPLLWSGSSVAEDATFVREPLP
jgi:tRNA-specific 2-thiouridylase